MKRAALYARVSTEGQRDNTSLESQLARCREYCAARGYEIVIEKREVISGSFVLARSEYNDLLQMAADGRIETIIVDIPDRLGRGEAITKCEFLADMNGAAVEYASPDHDVTTIEGFVRKSTDNLVSGMERMNIRRRLLQGKQNRAREGRVIETACRPYGYRFESTRDERGRKTSCTLEIVESEARVVREMFTWLVYECMTTYAIMQRLNEKNIPAPKGGRWTRRSVGLMLKSSVYVGQWQYGKSKFQMLDTLNKKKLRVVERNRADAICVTVPALIEKDLFDAAQAQLTENRRKFHRPAKVTYLLGSGRLKCATCHGTYSGATTWRDGKTWHYYRCRRSLSDWEQSKRCKGHVNGTLLDTAAWNCVREALLHPERLFKGISEMRQEQERAKKMIENNLAATVSQIDKANARLDRLVDLYTNGEIDKPTFTSKKGEIQAQTQKLESERQDTLARLGEIQILDTDDEKELRRVTTEIARRIDWGTAEERGKLFEMLRVICYFDYTTFDLTVTGLIGSHVVKVGIKSRNVRRQIPRDDTESPRVLAAHKTSAHRIAN